MLCLGKEWRGKLGLDRNYCLILLYYHFLIMKEFLLLLVVMNIQFVELKIIYVMFGDNGYCQLGLGDRK